MLSKHKRYYGLGMFGHGNTNLIIWLGHACAGKRMLSKHESYYGLDMDALLIGCSRTWKNAMHGTPVFRAFETPRMRGSSHAGHIRRGRPSMHFLRVYAPAEPITTVVKIMVEIIMIITIVMDPPLLPPSPGGR